MKKTNILGIVLLLTIILTIINVTADAPPSLTNYHQLYGQITNLPAGSFTFNVKINGNECTPAPCSVAVESNGRFGYNPILKVTAQSGQLTFFVVNAVGAAAPVGEAVTYQAGAVTYLSLSYQGGGAPPQPSPPPPQTPSSAAFDFSLADSGDETIRNGSKENITLTTALSSDLGQNVSFTLSGVPSGVTFTIWPATCLVPCISQIQFEVAATAIAGKTEITVSATNGTLTKTTTFDLKILTPMDFVLTQPAARTLLPGTTITQPINISVIKGTSQLISLAASAAPSGLTTTLSTMSCLPNCTATLTISGSIAGQYEVTITAKSGDDLKRATFPVTVTGTETTCTFNWQCGAWSACQNNRQTRLCSRLDNCNTAGANVRVIAAEKPAEEQSCTETPPVTTPPSTPPLCTTGTKRCYNSVLQQCTEGRWEVLQSCLGGCDSTMLQCKPLSTVPPSQQPTPSPKSWWYYLIGSLVLLIVIAVVLVAIIQKRKLAPAREYIHKSRLEGYSDEQIRKKLASAGWNEKDLAKLLK